MGIFGNMFDLNSDGKMDGFEQAAEFSFLMTMMEEEEKRNAEQDDTDLNFDEIEDE